MYRRVLCSAQCAKLGSNASEYLNYSFLLTNIWVAQWQYMKQGGKKFTQNKIGCKT